MPEPMAEFPKMMAEGATKFAELLKIPFTVPLAVGSALIETGKPIIRGGAGMIPTPQMLFQQTAALIQAPLAALHKGSEIVGVETETSKGIKTRTTIF